MEPAMNDCSCTICHQVFALPMTLHCGHTFCFECIHTNYVTHNNRTCPICREFIGRLPSNCNIILKTQIERHFESQPENQQAYQNRIVNGETMMNAHRERGENSRRRRSRRRRGQTNIVHVPELMTTFNDFVVQIIGGEEEEVEEENNGGEEEENNHENEFTQITLVPNALFQGHPSVSSHLLNFPFLSVPPRPPPPPTLSTTRRQHLAGRAELQAQIAVFEETQQQLIERRQLLSPLTPSPPRTCQQNSARIVELEARLAVLDEEEQQLIQTRQRQISTEVAELQAKIAVLEEEQQQLIDRQPPLPPSLPRTRRQTLARRDELEALLAALEEEQHQLIETQQRQISTEVAELQALDEEEQQHSERRQFVSAPPLSHPRASIPPTSSATRLQNLAQALVQSQVADQRLERRWERRVRNRPNPTPHQNLIQSTSEIFSQSTPNISAGIILQPNFPRVRRNRRQTTNANNFNRVLSRSLGELFMEQQQQNQNRSQNISRLDANRISPRPFFVSPALNFGFSRQRHGQRQPNFQATFSRVLSQANDAQESVNREENLQQREPEDAINLTSATPTQPTFSRVLSEADSDVLVQQTIINSLNQN